MTQLSSDEHLAKSQQKAAQVLSGNAGKMLRINSNFFYGSSVSRPRSQMQLPYMMCGRAVRSSATSFKENDERVWNKMRNRNSPLNNRFKRLGVRCQGNKSMSVPPPDMPREPLRTSLSSPPRKHRKVSSPRLNLAPDCRAKRVLLYGQSDTESSSPDFTPDDDSNKENFSNNLDITKIIETLDRDMAKDAAAKPQEAEELPPKQAAILPQDIGFPNPPGSNLCWMNATLQTLLGMEVFVEQLEQSTWRDDRNGQHAVLRTFFDVVRLRRHGRRLSLHSALRRLSQSLGALDSVFSSDRQQDATEFLVRLLDLFREQYSSSERCTLRELQLDNLPPGVQRADSDNPVCENVEFRLKETYSCDTCDESSSKSQDHLALFLDVPPTSNVRPSLQEALCRYMQPDVRELKCNRCNGQRTRVHTAFTKLPRFLLVQVKRYAVQTAIAEKLTDLLRVPIHLTVKDYVSSDLKLPAAWSPVSRLEDNTAQLSMQDDEEKELQEAMKQSLKDEDVEAMELEQAIQLSLQEQNLALAAQDADVSATRQEDFPFEGEEESPPELTYRLVCVIMHQGLSPNCGHYVADVYNLEQQQWYHYDDEVVSHPSEEEVIGKSRQRNGYVFCYMHRPLFDELSRQHEKL